MRAIYPLLVIVLCLDTAAALTVQVEGTIGGSTPDIVHFAGDSSPTSIAIEFFNESTSSPATLTLWQLHLMVMADPNAQGDVELSQIQAPSIPFFDSPGPGITQGGPLPSDDILAQDVDVPLPPDLPGKTIAEEEIREIAQLELSSPNNAAGTFYLVLGAFNTSSPLEGSVWLPDGMPAPTPFANVPGTELPAEIVLAKLLFGIQEADFNTDGSVDDLDLEIWQSDFGIASNATHAEGDSEGDGDVDGADFLNWQLQYSSPAVNPTQIPEPSSSLLAAIVWTVFSVMNFRTERQAV